MRRRSLAVTDIATRAGRVRRFVLDSVLILATTIVLVLVANAVCSLLLREFPAWSEDPAAQVTREYNERFYARQADYVTRWLALDNPEQLQAFFDENTAHAQAAN